MLPAFPPAAPMLLGMLLLFPFVLSVLIRFKTLLYSFVRASVTAAWVFVHQVCAWYWMKAEEGVGSPGTGVIGGYEPPCGC